MWGLNRFQRPAWTTATTLPLAFLCGLGAAFYIYWGGRKTKRHEQVEERLRTALALETPRQQQIPTVTVTAEEGPSSTQPGQDSSSSSTGEYSRVIEAKPDTSKAESTPILPSSDLKHQDFVGHDEVQPAILYRRDRLESAPSAATVRISDYMTIPPVEELHEFEGAAQGYKR